MSNELIKYEISDVIKAGQIFVKSTYCNGGKKSLEDVIATLIAGREMGIPDTVALSNIHIIQGKPTIGANILASKIKSSNKYNYIVLQNTDTECEIEFHENKQTIGISKFSMTDAKRGGLDGKDNWKKFPSDMLFARALSRGCRRFCPDVLNGITPYTPEEINNEKTIEYIPPMQCHEITIEAPKPPSKPTLKDSSPRFRNFLATMKKHDIPVNGDIKPIIKDRYDADDSFMLTDEQVDDLERHLIEQHNAKAKPAVAEDEKEVFPVNFFTSEMLDIENFEEATDD